MNIKNSSLKIILFFSMIFWSVLTVAQEVKPSKFISFDVQDNGIAYEINSVGDIIGDSFNEKKEITYGFLRQKNGEIKTIYIKNPDITDVDISPNAINDSGFITGAYSGWSKGKQSFFGHGFIRSPEGKLTTFDVPGFRATPTDMNEAGDIVGSTRTDEDEPKQASSFIRYANGRIVTFEVPGVEKSYPVAINKNGIIAGSTGGSYTDSEEMGYVRMSNGDITTFKVPGAYNTRPIDMNDNGVIVGECSDEKNKNKRGFIRTLDGAITTLSIPNATETDIVAINNEGIIVGMYTDTLSEEVKGFMRMPDSSILTIAYPKTDVTEINGINASGVVIGRYYDKKEKAHNFILNTRNDMRYLQ